MQRRERRKKKKKKKKHRDDDDDDDVRMMTRHITHPRTTMMTARLTPSSGPPEGSSGKLMRRATHK